jgi:tetratricopeptide (TPR) repeat protein
MKKYGRTILIAVIAALVLPALVLTPMLLNSGTKSAPGNTKQPSIREVVQLSDRLASGGLTDQQIEAYQQKLKKSEDTASYAKLGQAYLQKAREIGDPVYYSKAEQVFKRALELDANNVEAMGGMGALALSRHQFTEALEWGEKARTLKPFIAYNYGVIVDAQVELGRYDDATKTLQAMVDLRPDISSYSRVSYLRELYGKTDGAIEAMKQAVQAGSPTPEGTSWVLYQLGNLYFNKNDLTTAETAYLQALTVSPNYVYAQAGMAKLTAARGNFEAAISQLEDVTRRMPLPEFVILLGDVYTAAGKTDAANRQYELVRQIERIYKANGVVTDLDMALFDADHAHNLPESLARVRQQYKLRPDIKAADALAWTLYQSGDYNAALEYSTKALQLGTQDSLYLYHHGMILAKLGKTSEARATLQKALDLNPHFSFRHAANARTAIANLGKA